jgi:outer membrane lipoprotein-sorting protein
MMQRVVRWGAVVVVGALWAVSAHAQTADEVVEKHLAALGGRAALAKLENRVATGSVTITTQGINLSGPVELYVKAPNKSRSLIKLDLTQFGAGEMVIDQRCDGKTAYAANSVQGDREITGNQLENLLNASFPSSLLNYKDAGAKVELAGKEQVGDRTAYVLVYTPKAGSVAREFIDAETYLMLRSVQKIDVAELGGEIEQTSDMSDYRDVGGYKVPFSITTVNPAQTVKISLANVEHNKPIDDAMFSRPAVK